MLATTPSGQEDALELIDVPALTRLYASHRTLCGSTTWNLQSKTSRAQATGAPPEGHYSQKVTLKRGECAKCCASEVHPPYYVQQPLHQDAT